MILRLLFLNAPPSAHCPTVLLATKGRKPVTLMMIGLLCQNNRIIIRLGKNNMNLKTKRLTIAVFLLSCILGFGWLLAGTSTADERLENKKHFGREGRDEFPAQCH